VVHRVHVGSVCPLVTWENLAYSVFLLQYSQLVADVSTRSSDELPADAAYLMATLLESLPAPW
jgi:hypothetical protein